MKPSKFLSLAALLLIALFTSCGQEPPSKNKPKPNNTQGYIEVSTGYVRLACGQSVTIQATVWINGEAMTDATLVWKSSDPSLATVDSHGTVTATSDYSKEGSVEITVSYDDLSTVVSIYVSKPQLAESLRLNGDDVVYKYDSTQFSVQCSPVEANLLNYVWQSSDPSVASVSNEGVVYGHSAGTATITVTAEGGAADSRKITVKVPTIEFEQSSVDIYYDYPSAFPIKVTPESAAGKLRIRYKSSDESVATISSDGLVTGRKMGGSATITATTEDSVQATCTVKVVAPFVLMDVSNDTPADVKDEYAVFGSEQTFKFQLYDLRTNAPATDMQSASAKASVDGVVECEADPATATYSVSVTGGGTTEVLFEGKGKDITYIQKTITFKGSNIASSSFPSGAYIGGRTDGILYRDFEFTEGATYFSKQITMGIYNASNEQINIAGVTWTWPDGAVHPSGTYIRYTACDPGTYNIIATDKQGKQLTFSLTIHEAPRTIKVGNQSFSYKWFDDNYTRYIGFMQVTDGTPLMQYATKFSEAFGVCTTEVTQGLWRTVTGKNPSTVGIGDNYPVNNVNYADCQAFISQLNQTLATTYPGISVSLPTEAQWEVAAHHRATSSTYKSSSDSYYPGSSVLDDVAWYSKNSKKTTHPVGQKMANGNDCYDMAGNVQEWCLDWYNDYYPTERTDDYSGPATGKNRVVRGGHYASEKEYECCWFSRNYQLPTERNPQTGLRLAVHFKVGGTIVK